MSYRDEARRALESRAARETQNQFLKRSQSTYSALQGFDDVEALLGVLWDPRAPYETKDSILLALLQEHQREGGQAFTLIARAMFEKLEHLYIVRLPADDDDDLWGRIVGAFAEALDRYPVSRRPSKVAANIEGETMAALRRANQRERRVTDAQNRFVEETAPFLKELLSEEPQGASPLALGDFVTPGQELPVPPDADEVARAARILDPFVAEEVLDTEERFLILGLHLYERSLRELAADLGISREAAKKRHRRAISRLRSSQKGEDEDS